MNIFTTRHIYALMFQFLFYSSYDWMSWTHWKTCLVYILQNSKN